MSNISAHVGQKMIDQQRRQRLNDMAAALRSKCRAVDADERIIGVYSMGEVCAVSLILNRMDLLPTGYTALDAMDRLDEGMLAICVHIQRNGWT